MTLGHFHPCKVFLQRISGLFDRVIYSIRGWPKIVRLILAFSRKGRMMFPVQAFTIVLDFAKGNRPWSVDVFEAILDLMKWCYRSISGSPQVVGDSKPEITDPIDALEQLQMASNPNVATFNPLLISFVLQFLTGLILEKLKK